MLNNINIFTNKAINSFSVCENSRYIIWATDNNLNSVSSENIQYFMAPNYDIDMDGNQNVLDLIYIS